MAYSLVKMGGDGENFGTYHREYLVDSSSDITDLPAESAPGSVAYTASLDHIWQKANGGTWTLMD